MKRFAFIAAACVAAVPAFAQCGQASYYGHESGVFTATGERFRPDSELTAAMRDKHRFGSTIRVTNQRNGRSVRVRVNDFGPAARTRRIIDLSVAAGRALGIIRAGHAPVCID